MEIVKKFILPNKWHDYLMDVDGIMPDNEISLAVSRFFNEVCPGEYDDNGFKHSTHFNAGVIVNDIGFANHKEYIITYNPL